MNKLFFPVLIAIAAALSAGCHTTKPSPARQAAKTKENPGTGFVPLTVDMPAPKEEPRVIDPGPPPSDAIILFDGKDLSKWKGAKPGQPAQWKVEDGYMEANGTGHISTKEGFGDCQLHVEWATPAVVKGDGQGRGNSGIFLQGRYELQVLDSYQNKTYYNGQAGAIYKEYAPLVNACRKPGEWQTYDVIYHAPKFDANGTVLKGARITVIQNGVLVQDNVEIKGHTANVGVHKYVPHGPKEPLMLQDHHNPVRFRNIWIRELR